MESEVRKNILMIAVVFIIISILLGVLVVGAKTQHKTIRILTKQTEENIKFDKEKMNIYFFYGDGCSHCEELIFFLNNLPEKYNEYYDLYTLEVWYDEKNNELMRNLVKKIGKTVEGVPCLIIGDQVFFGYSETMNEKIKQAIKEESKEKYDVYKKFQQ